MNEPIKADDYLSALAELRLLVFIECDPDECPNPDNAWTTRHFHQVLLTSRQFKKVSDAIITSRRNDPDLKEGFEMATFRVDGEFPPEPFDGLSSTID
jgi:hypothetical protein